MTINKTMRCSYGMFLSAFCLLSCSGIATAAQSSSSTKAPAMLTELLNTTAPSKDQVKEQLKKMTQSVRLNAVLDQAYMLGSQAGLYWRGTALQDTVSKQARTLDIIWNFQQLMLENGRILPPIIGDLRESQEIKASTRVYIGRDLVIIRDARFVQHAPNWRIYLMASQFTKPDSKSFNPILYPTDSEKQAWNDKILVGWDAGVHQADMIMMDNIHRLSRDYVGMIRYHVLLKMGMVTPPFVTEKRDNVVGDGKHMSIDRRTQHISVVPKLNINNKRWVAVPAIKDMPYDRNL